MTLNQTARSALLVVLRSLEGRDFGVPLSEKPRDAIFYQRGQSVDGDDWQDAAEKLGAALAEALGKGPVRFFILPVPQGHDACLVSCNGVALRYVADFYDITRDAFVSRFDVGWVVA